VSFRIWRVGTAFLSLVSSKIPIHATKEPNRGKEGVRLICTYLLLVKSPIFDTPNEIVKAFTLQDTIEHEEESVTLPLSGERDVAQAQRITYDRDPFVAKLVKDVGTVSLVFHFAIIQDEMDRIVFWGYHEQRGDLWDLLKRFWRDWFG
jgi:hypothetical protein